MNLCVGGGPRLALSVFLNLSSLSFLRLGLSGHRELADLAKYAVRKLQGPMGASSSALRL